MANQVITRTVRSETKKRLSIEGSYIDSLIVGGTWTKIRLGMRFSVTHNASVSSPPSIYFGLASSTGDVVGQTTPKHFLGVRTNPTISFAYEGNDTNGYIFRNGLQSSIYVNGTATNANLGNQGGDYGAAMARTNTNTGDSNGLLYAFFVEITKGSPNYSLTGFSPIRGGGAQYNSWHIDGTKFKSLMDSDTLPTGFPNVEAFGPASIAIDETTNGVLDTVNVAWQGSAFPIEIANLAVKVLA